MNTMPFNRRGLAALVAGTVLASRARAQVPTASPAPLATSTVRLDQIAAFDMQVTGVAVAPNGRIFVNFPRWEQDVPISVAEVAQDGTLTPYPNAAWNAWTNAKPLSNKDHFVCVQSVTIDPQGFLWVLDPAAPGNKFNLDGGPKALKVDLATNRVVRVFPFDRAVCPQGSYLNDIRFSPDGHTAYLTDSGVRGALLVLDVRTGRIRRLLDGNPSTQVEKDVKVKTDGQLLTQADGEGPQFAADGIAVSRDGRYVYWQALTGKTLYRIATDALRNPTLSQARLEDAIERLGTTCVADGYWMDRNNQLWITSPEDNSVKRRRADGALEVIVRDDRLRWPDSMAEGSDGTLYVTASHIQDMAQFRGSPRRGKTQLFRFTPQG